MSLRRIALLLGTSRTTVARKLIFLGEQCRARQRHKLEQLCATEGGFTRIQFDDLETFEHTKCKPATVTVVVCQEARIILDVEVAQIAANGPLAAISRKKYGKRKDRSRKSRHKLFKRLVPLIAEDAQFSSDEHAHYPLLMRQHFPQAIHKRYKSIRGASTAQGELKKIGYDPLFSVNHTLAMLRANLNRLVRRTWCTSKKLSCLALHLWLYIDYHNDFLLTEGKPPRGQYHAQ